MKIQFGRRFWIVATQSYYSEKIAQDSTLLERLKYDDYLEEYARENYHMQGRNEHVYIIRE